MWKSNSPQGTRPISLPPQCIITAGINKDIWVVGSSIIQRAGEHSKIRLTGTFLGLQQLGCQLVWVGLSLISKNGRLYSPSFWYFPYFLYFQNTSISF
jgi:hypothetical protein